MRNTSPLLIVLCTATALTCLLGQPATRGATQDSQADAEDRDYQRRVKEYEERSKHQDEQEKRADNLITREEAFVKRQEENSERFDKILATWERQQQEYQRYLDTLPKK